MGKKGNKARQQAKKHATLDENILNAIAEDDYREAKARADAARDIDNQISDEQYQSASKNLR
jgi:hypothetical protein